MNWAACPYCNREFSSHEAVIKHMRSLKGHGKKICPNCKESLKYCKDVAGVIGAFQCESKRKIK